MATPATALRLAVPASVAPSAPVPLLIASDTEAVLEVRLLCASSRRTVTAGAIVAPESVFVGCWPKASCVAGPGVKTTCAVCRSAVTPTETE